MTNRERGRRDPGGGGAGDIVLRAACRVMQHRVERAVAQRAGQGGGEGRGDGAIDDTHRGLDAVGREFCDEIGRAVLAGEIEQRLSVTPPCSDEADEIVHITVGGCDVGKARPARRLGAARADGVKR